MFSREVDSFLSISQELYGREGRRAATFRRLAASVPGVSAVQEASEVGQQRLTRHTKGTLLLDCTSNELPRKTVYQEPGRSLADNAASRSEGH